MKNYQLKGKDAKKLDILVDEGIKGYKAGKCRLINFLADLEKHQANVEFIRRMRQARQEHLSGQTKNFDKLKNELLK